MKTKHLTILAAFCLFFPLAAQNGYAFLSGIETPTGIYFDEITSTAIMASGYAATPAFTGLETGQAGVNVAMNGTYSIWRNGNIWTTKAAMPTANRDSAVGVIGGKLYVVGGSDGYSTTFNTNEEYDPASNTWATKAVMPTARKYLSAGAIGGKLYAVGGYNDVSALINTNEEYDPASNTWTTKAAIPTVRGFFSAGVIGGRLYAVGGWNGSYLDTNEEYDPAYNTWTTKTAMPTARGYLAVGVIGGKLYAVGGTNNGGPTLFNTNEEYDPASNTWTTKAVMPTARYYLSAGAIGGKLYAVGGYNNSSTLSTNEEYDPASNTWTAKVTMPTVRCALSAGVTGGKLYAVGGTSGGMNTNEEYDPGVALQFTGLTPNTLYSFKAKARDSSGLETAESPTVSTYTLAAIPAAASPVFTSVGTSTFTLNWLANGDPSGTRYHAQISTSAAFTPVMSSDTYNLAATFTGLPSGTTYYARIAAINNDGISTSYAALGSIHTSGAAVSVMAIPTGIYFDEVSSTTIVASGYAATPAFAGLETGLAGVNVAKNGTYSTWRNGNIWTTKAVMPTARYLLSAGVIGGKLYAVGGTSDGSSYLNTNEEYDPASNTWATKAAMPTARYWLSAGVIGSKLYAVGGWNGNHLSTNEEYDPVSNTWTTKTAMPTARPRLSVGVIGGKLYAVGGSQTNGGGDTNEEYDLASNTWTTKTVMPTARDSFSIGVIGGKLYAVGGTNNGGSTLFNTNEEYDPASDTWTTKAAMPTARCFSSAGVIGGKLYAVGGWGNSTVLNTNEEYDPASDTWTTKAAMPTAKYMLSAGVIGGKLYAVGAANGGMNTNEEYDPGVSQQFTGLTPNTLYSFKAKARDAGGVETAESPTVSTYTLAALPAAGSPVFTSGGASSFAVNWLANGNPSGTRYRAQISASPAFTSVISMDTYGTAATFTSISLGANYYARVAAINGGGIFTDYVALGSLTAGTVIGNRQKNFKTTIGDNLFNPSAGGTSKIKFNVPAAGKVSLKIYDLTGRLIRTLFEGDANAGDTQKDWDGRDDSGHYVVPGVYFLHYVYPGGKEVRKIGVKK